MSLELTRENSTTQFILKKELLCLLLHYLTAQRIRMALPTSIRPVVAALSWIVVNDDVADGDVMISAWTLSYEHLELSQGLESTS